MIKKYIQKFPLLQLNVSDHRGKPGTYDDIFCLRFLLCPPYFKII